MLEESAIREARAAVEPMARRLGIGERLAEFAAHRWTGELFEAPVLHVEDVSGIPFVDLVPGVEEYQHRARVRAGDGDLFAAVTPPTEGFEEYCRERLRLGSPEFVLARPDRHPYAVAKACHGDPAFARIVERAAAAGALLVHPYMAIETVWDLARQIAARSAARVEVLGPPPPALWIANDKAHLSEVVRSVLSADWLVETHTATDPAQMVDHLRKLAERHALGGLKRTRCASAMGNAVYDLRRIAAMPQEEILTEVRAFLERTEWALDEEVLVVVWEDTDLSPSTQLWLPPLDSGRPIVEGVYEQLLEGEARIFLGSRPSTQSSTVHEMLIDASVRVGAGLQALGYVGRCSFDFIVVEEQGVVRAKFVECNGRWGGTSTPMRLVDRLIPGTRPCYRAQDFMHHDLIGIPFDDIVRRLEDVLYDPVSGRGNYVLYNVGPLARHGKLDVVALGSTQHEAEKLLREDFPRRLGLDPLD